MPRPHYILCSESGAEDARTGLLSHFTVIEKVNFVRRPPQGLILSVPLRVTAVWMKLPDDPEGQEYEFETEFFLPEGLTPDGRPFIVHTGRFVFQPGQSLYRIMLFVNTFPPMERPGIFRVENRIRPNGGGDWVRQDYPIVIAETETGDVPANQ